MPWANQRLSLYHGTIGPHADSIQKNIDFSYAKPKRDFGKGFYTTRIYAQARRFAIFKFREALDDHHKKGAIDPQVAAVVEFEINLVALEDLRTLAFVQPTPDWRDFVAYCRRTGRSHKPNNEYYQAVYGPVHSSRGAIPRTEQLSFHDDYAISLLRIVRVERWLPPP
jgi:hypothetical protein